jgi:hypothetical protein
LAKCRVLKKASVRTGGFKTLKIRNGAGKQNLLKQD